MAATMTPPPAPPSPPAGQSTAKKLSWIGLLYFAEGLPFGVITEFVPVWLRNVGVSNTAIGLLALPEAPWSWKFAWSPLIDAFGQRRHWIFAAQLGAALMLAMAALIGASQLTLLGLALIGFTTLAATSDIAIDAYTIGLLRPGEEGPANSVRVATYRIALLFVGGPLVLLGGIFGWSTALLALSLLIAALGFAAWISPQLPIDRRGSVGQTMGQMWRSSGQAFLRWATRDGAWALALMALLYKVPDAALGPMIRTFWVDSGIDPQRIGAILTPINMGATIVGSIVGGFVIARLGIVASLFYLGLLQALSNVVYALTAIYGGSLASIAVAAAVENVTGGLGTAAFLSFLMRAVEKERAATEYALLSALFALARFPLKLVSGIAVDRFGFAGWFALSTLTAIPALLLVFSPVLARRMRETPFRLGITRPIDEPPPDHRDGV